MSVQVDLAAPQGTPVQRRGSRRLTGHEPGDRQDEKATVDPDPAITLAVNVSSIAATETRYPRSDGT